jgi:hypothetical protein
MTVEHREHRELKVNPEGVEDVLPRTFRLDAFTAAQRRDGRQRTWLDETPRQRTTLAEGITRPEAVDLISQLADWLAWDGKNG